MSADGTDAGLEIDAAELRNLTVDLINIPSPTGSEDAAALFVHDILRDMGLKTWTQEVEPGRRNVVGMLRGTGGGPTLMLMGHLDTVWAGDEDGIRDLGPGFQPQADVDGDWIYGMGAYNMKSGLTSAIAALKAIVQSGRRIPGNIILAAIVGETARCQVDRYQGPRYRAAGVGAWHLVTGGVMADMAIVPEPTYFRISIASGGYVYFRVRALGVPGATYQRGGKQIGVADPVDALTQMIDIREAVLKWASGYTDVHLYQGERATNVSVIGLDAGLPFRPTKVPPIARMYVEVDMMPGQRTQDIIEEFSAMVEEECDALGVKQMEVDVLQTVSPAEISSDEYVVKALSQAHSDVLGVSAEVTFDAWMADTTALTRAGIPALCYGPGGRMRQGGSGYYAPDGEQCYVPDLIHGAEIYARAAADICSLDRNEFIANLPKSRGTVVT